MEDHAKSAHSGGGSKPYVMMAVNLGLSLLVMYVAMFAMIWSWGEFIQNVNFFYMALVMWAPMGAIMLATMGGMYRNRKLNAALYVAFAAIFVLSLIIVVLTGRALRDSLQRVQALARQQALPMARSPSGAQGRRPVGRQSLVAQD